MARAVIVRTRRILPRADGRMIRFDDSACVLLNAKGEMMGTRIAGPVSALLRDAEGNQPGGRWAKVLAVAPKVSRGDLEWYRSVADGTRLFESGAGGDLLDIDSSITTLCISMTIGH